MTTHDSQGRPHWKGSSAHKLVLARVKEAFDEVLDGKVLRKERLPDDREIKTMIRSNAQAFEGYTKAAIKKKIDQEV
jgi:hypothetical protein